MTRMIGAIVVSAGLGLCVQALSPASALAEEPVCPAGTYWNPVVVQCLPYGVNPVIGPGRR